MKIGFTEHAQMVLQNATEQAQSLGHPYIGTEHILLGILLVDDCKAGNLLHEKGVTYENAKHALVDSVGEGSSAEAMTRDYTPRTKRVIENAAAIAAQCGTRSIGTEHLLFSLLNETDSYAAQIMQGMEISLGEIQQELMKIMQTAERNDTGNGSRVRDYPKGTKEASVKNAPALSEYGRDLCAMAKEGKIDPVIGRDEETERVIQILSRRTKNNPCLIGEPGVGKTAVVEGLAQRIVNHRVPEMLENKQIVTLDLSAMIAGAKYRGEFEDRLKKVMSEVAANKNIILFIDEIHTVIGAGAGEGAVDAANIIKPALARGEMQLIGATTITEYRKYIEKDEAFERRFQPVTVGEPTPEDAVLILQGLKEKYEAHHKVTITDEAISAAVHLSSRYIGDRYLPDKAIDLIDEAASKKRIAQCKMTPEMEKKDEDIKKLTSDKEEAIHQEKYEEAAKLRDQEQKARNELEEMRRNAATSEEKLTVTADDIADVVTAWTHIPVKKLADEEGSRLLHLEDMLKARVIGQEEAVCAVAKAIRRGRVGLKNPKRPTGSFIFLGPTGVGKTELCKALAEVMFGDENAMVRIDMSEYMEKHSVSKLIGSPPGYVGFEEGGQLTEKIRRHPYTVVLFDEIEKAHPDVFNILLQILEDGRLTDGQGRMVDFKNTIIIMTSNCGAAQMNETKHFGFTSAKETIENDVQKEEMLRSLKETFRPEFLNRIDEIIVFNKLSDEDICKIASLMLEDVIRRVNENRIKISFSDEVIQYLGKVGFDPIYGARPLRRAIVRLVEDQLSEAMLSGNVSQGDSVKAQLDHDRIVFVKE